MVTTIWTPAKKSSATNYVLFVTSMFVLDEDIGAFLYYSDVVMKPHLGY